MNKRFGRIVFALVVVMTLFTLSALLPRLPGWPTSERRNQILASPVSAQDRPIQTDFALYPSEIDLGLLGPGDTVKSVLTLRKKTSGPMIWTLIPPAGWNGMEQKSLSRTTEEDIETLRLQVQAIEEPKGSAKPGDKTSLARLSFESGGQTAVFSKRIEPGSHKEIVRLQSNGGYKTFSILFRFVDVSAEPLLGIEPPILDMGVTVQGEPASQRIRLNNRGWSTLKWKATPVDVADSATGSAVVAGRYISFHNEASVGAGHYDVAGHLRDRLEVRGRWAEDQGYPSSQSAGEILRLHFSGTGIDVYCRKGRDAGQLEAYLDDHFVSKSNSPSEQWERAEWPVARGLANGVHVLTLKGAEGPVTVEGVRVYGDETLSLQSKLISILPNNGAATRQTNYVNITVQSKPLAPGHYSGAVFFDSNGGQKEVEISLDVIADNLPKILDSYRYARGADYFFTTNPQAESVTLQTRGYVKQGISFRLFLPGTPGTTEFYRWYHPQKGDHYYGYDLKSTKRSMRGYLSEGTIGNIATSRLSNTRELYRWYHPYREHYFYSVDPDGEGIQKKGYRYDGIAGYVRP